jgi:hypothetical protein
MRVNRRPNRLILRLFFRHLGYKAPPRR